MIYSISSLKGGVGKTTIAIFLARALTVLGRKVLSIDLDHNNNLTDFYIREEDGASAEGIEGSGIRQLLAGSGRLEGVALDKGTIWRSPLGYIVPATPSLATVALELAHDQTVGIRLRRDLRRLEGYDDIILDLPPSLTLELSVGLMAADTVLVPVTSQRWTVQGYEIIKGEVARIADLFGNPPRILAIPSMVTDSEAEAIQSVDIWQATDAYIKRDPAIKAAASEGRDLKPNTLAARAFAALAEEVGK